MEKLYAWVQREIADDFMGGQCVEDLDSLRISLRSHLQYRGISYDD